MKPVLLLLFLLGPLGLAGCTDSGATADQCVLDRWHPPGPLRGATLNYLGPAGPITVRVIGATNITDGFGVSQPVVEFEEERPDESSHYFLDRQTRLLVAWDEVGTRHFAQPYFEWFRREQIFGHAPYLLPYSLATGGGLPCTGSQTIHVLGSEIVVAGHREGNRLEIALEFPQQETPEGPIQRRSTTMTLDATSGAVVAFGDLLALGQGFFQAKLESVQDGIEPIPWLTYMAPTPGAVHPDAKLIGLHDPAVLDAELPLDGRSALESAMLAPGYRQFELANTNVFLAAAYFTASPSPTWTFQFASASGGASYEVQSSSHDVEVRGTTQAGVTAAAPTMEGRLKEFSEPLFAPRYAGSLGRTSMGHAVELAQQAYDQFEFAYVERYDPGRWPGAEEATLEVQSTDIARASMLFSLVNGQVLEATG